MWSKFFMLVGGVLLVMSVAAQKGATLKGYVLEDKSEEPMLTRVIVQDTVAGKKFQAYTNGEGYYQITNIAPGSYDVIVTSQGYSNFSENITFASGQIITKKIFMKEGTTDLGIIRIVDERDPKTNPDVSVTKAKVGDIKGIPVVGGTRDIVNYLTAAVPGAITTGDQGGQVYIRGGSPIQNKVLLDGMIIYNPFHSIGFFSVFDTDIIREADIYTGGFGAEFGGRISSVMDIKTIDGRKDQFGGKIEVNPFGSKIMVEGPIWNNTKKGGSSASYVFSGKTSYLEQTSPVLYNYVNGDDGLPFNFLDLYGKFSINGAAGSKFNLFGFNFSDQVRYQAISDLSWNSYGIGSNFTLVPQSSNVLIEGDFSFSDYDITLKEENLADRFSRVNGFNFGMDFTYLIEDNEIKYGIEVQGFRTEFQTFNAVGREINQDQNTTELGGYLRYKIVSKNKLWVLDPSFRLHYYASLREISPEPRLGVKYNATEKLRFKLAAGIYSQNLIQANSDRDVVNLFYGFLSGPDNLQDEIITQDGETVERRHSLQKANHYILGFEYDLLKREVEGEKDGVKFMYKRKVTVNVEGYIKDFTQLTNINRNKIFDESQFDKPDVLKKDFIIETGVARGIDFLLKYSDQNKFLWIVYSIGKVDRWDGFIEYAPIFDRRHNINLVGAIKFGKDNSWEMNHRWNFGSGFPFTQTAGFYEPINFGDGISTDYTSVNSSELGFQYDSLNTGRLPTYHRYDITISKSFMFYGRDDDGKIDKTDLKSKLQIDFGVTNLYDRKNVFYVNRVTSEVVRQLPVLPSLGFTYSF